MKIYNVRFKNLLKYDIVKMNFWRKNDMIKPFVKWAGFLQEII